MSKLRLDLRSQPELVLFESIDTLDPQILTEKEWPIFTPDIDSSYSLFITCASTVHFVSLKPWLEGLEKELQSSLNAGLAIRLGVLLESAHTLCEQILRVQYTNDEDYERSLTAAVLIQNSNLGYVMLTTNGDQPQAVILDSPEVALKTEPDPEIEIKSEPEVKLLTMAPVRSAYQPPEAFWAKSSLSNFIDKHVPNRYKKVLKEEIRLSGATLDVMTEAHRFLSKETHLLGLAAADLFRRCERLHEEFHDQIKRADEVALRIEQLNDDDADDVEKSDKAKGAAKIESRILKATERHKKLTEKHEALRRKLAKLSGKELSNEEKAFTGEVDKMAALILKAKEPDTGEDDEDGEHEEEEEEHNAFLARLNEVCDSFIIKLRLLLRYSATGTSSSR
jgi:nucleoporin NUP82